MCNIIKPVTFVLSAVSAVLCLTGTDFFVRAYDAPQDIHLSIEVKEIDIDEIPENRVISLDIYTENCPPYAMLSFLLEKDSRLEYLPYTYLSDAEQVYNMSGMSFESASADFPDVVMCNIPAVANEQINYNGLLVRANVILPENVNSGEFYSLNFKRTLSDTYKMETSLMLENDFDSIFGNGSFSQLNGGGILITEKDQPVPEIHIEQSQEYIPEETQSPPVEEEEITQEVENAETVPAETTVETTVSEYTTTSTLSSAHKKTTSSTVSKPETTAEVSSETKTVTVTVTDEVTEISDKKSMNKPLIIAVSSVVVLTAVSAILINKKKQK